MTNHLHGDSDGSAGLGDLLDLDAEAFKPSLTEVTECLGRLAGSEPRRILDLGAGTGTGTLLLAQRFTAAEVIAVDASATMVDRLKHEVHQRGLTSRVHTVQADLDVMWPAIGSFDVAWAASSLHHMADPDRVFRNVYAALNAGGVFAVIEMDAQPRFLPDDLGIGRPGLEQRCHEAMAQAGWNAHPDWRSHLEQAGFDLLEQRTVAAESDLDHQSAARYAQTFLRRLRSHLNDQLAPDDLAVLDRLLTDGGQDSVLRRRDLRVRGSRTVWMARRPA